MGMFPAQNYGADFVNAMSATAGMMNDRRRLDMEEKRQAEDAKTRSLQQAGLAQENEQRDMNITREKNLQKYMSFAGTDLDSLDDSQAKEMGDLVKYQLKETPFTPDTIDQFPAYRQAMRQVGAGMQALRPLPASNYIYTRADKIPEIDAGLDAFTTLLSKDRLGKQFTDHDGSVTGTPGGTYRTANVGGFAVHSGEGDKAAFTPLFTVTDAQGNPFVGQDGTPRMVPSTVGQTNGPNDPLRMVTPEEVLTKVGYGLNLMDQAERLAGKNPEFGQQLMAERKLIDKPATRKAIAQKMMAHSGADGAKRFEEQVNAEQLGGAVRKATADAPKSSAAMLKVAADLLESGEAKDIASAVALARTIKPEKSYLTLKEGERMLDPDTRAVLADNPRADKEKYLKTEEGVKGRPGWVRDVYTDAEGKVVKSGEPRQQFSSGAADGGAAEKKMLSDALERRKKALSTYNAINGSNGKEYTGPDGTKRQLTAGDLVAAQQELEMANDEVKRFGGGAAAYVKPTPVVLNANAKVLRTKYEQFKESDPDKADSIEQSARKQGYSENDIRYMKGELDSKLVKFGDAQQAAPPQTTAKPAARGMAAAKAPVSQARGYVYQNGKLIPR